MTLRAKFWVWSFCSTLYRQRLKVLLLDVQRASSSLLLPRLPAPPSLPFPSLFLSVSPHKHNRVNTTLLLVWLKWYLPARNVGTGHGSCHIWKHLPSRLNSWSLFRFFFFFFTPSLGKPRGWQTKKMVTEWDVTHSPRSASLVSNLLLTPPSHPPPNHPASFKAVRRPISCSLCHQSRPGRLRPGSQTH